MNQKRILLLVVAFVLLTANAFAYPSLNGNCAFIGKSDLYWLEIDTSKEYYWDDPNDYPAVDVVTVMSFTDEGRQAYFNGTPYEGKAQWLVAHFRYGFYPNHRECQRFSYQLLDGNKNILSQDTATTFQRFWEDSPLYWQSDCIVGFIHDQFRNGAYTNSDGKVCYN